MAPVPTPQGVTTPTFNPAPFDHGFSVPGLYEYHARNSPSHAVFTYSNPEGGSSHDVTYAEAWRHIGFIARAISRYVSSPSQVQDGEQSLVIGVLAHADTITYIYTLLAIMSLGHVAFPLGPRNTVAATAHLLESTGASHLLFGQDAAVQALADGARLSLKEIGRDLHLHPIVTHEEYSTPERDPKTHSVRDIADTDVTIILHSSGTTAMPKPIEMTRRGLANLSNIPCYGEVDLAGKRIAAHTNPAFHAMGLGTLMWPLTSGATFALYKPASPPVIPTPANFLASWVAHKCNIVFCVPIFIEARDSANLSTIQSLDCIVFSGASVSKAVGDILANAGVAMHPFWGSTEVGPATMFIPRDPPPVDEWEYFKLSHHIEFVMQPQEGFDKTIFEPIMIPTETCFPHVTNSELGGRPVFAVGDLLEQHPTDPARWWVFGRKDDQIMLSTGENANPVPMEAVIGQDPHVASAIIFGRHRAVTGLLVEPVASYELPPRNTKILEEFKDAIWSTIERANASAPPFARVTRDMILVTSPEKPLEHTPKGAPRRGVCLKLYSAEIDELYAREEGDAYAGTREFPDRV